MEKKRKRIVFDMDDVLWELNRRVAAIKNVPYEKFTQFALMTNPNMTEAEKQRVMEGYRETATYQDILFDREMIGLVNRLHEDHPEYLVSISSNSTTKEIRDAKMEQLREVLTLPEEQIYLHVIDLHTQSLQKDLPKHMFLFVDDSPHNIVLSNVTHRIMPARPYNRDVLDENGRLGSHKIDRPRTSKELVRLVETYISET